MHQFTRAKTLLGGQQSLRLQQLQDRSDDLIHHTHLLQPPPRALRSSIRERHGLKQTPPSQTVEAILEARLQQLPPPSEHGSAAARLRNKIDAARSSIRTERSVRPEPLVPPLVATRDDMNSASAAHMASLPATTQRRIVAVRRRKLQQLGEADTAHDGPQRRSGARLGKAEQTWVEKQLQLTQRAAMLERECESWWRQFYGASSGAAAPVALAVHKSFDELAAARAQDTRLMMQQLAALRQKQRGVADKLARMRSGETFFADLQELLDDLETAITAFRRSQRERYDAFAAEERVLEKELSAFVAKVDEWDAESSASAARARSALSTRQRRTGAGAAPRPAGAQDSSVYPGRSSDDTAAAPGNNNDGDDDIASEVELLARVRSVNERILQTGGVQGGWDDREHRVFTSLLRKFGLSDAELLAHQTSQVTAPSPPQPSNQEQHERASSRASSADDYETRVAQCLQQIIAKVVTRSAAAVRCHLIWYIDHLSLLQQKRDAIHAWRAKKERMRLEFISQGLVQVTDAPGSRERTSPDKHALSGAGDARDEQRHAARARAQTVKLLSQWRETKAERAKQERARERALAQEQEARDAKRKQELLDAKQQVLLYKLQKEQHAALLEQQQRRPLSSRSQPSPDSAASVSPVSKHELLERSRQAIELAKAKRAKLQAREAKQQKQRELPARPPRAVGDASATASPGASSPALLLQPTKASQARERTKRELRKHSAMRERQNAHDAVIPGAAAIPDAKVKSFGHVPIQPRAVPAWRRDL